MLEDSFTKRQKESPPWDGTGHDQAEIGARGSQCQMANALPIMNSSSANLQDTAITNRFEDSPPRLEERSLRRLMRSAPPTTEARVATNSNGDFRRSLLMNKLPLEPMKKTRSTLTSPQKVITDTLPNRRRTRWSSPTPEQEPRNLWTSENPDWAKGWDRQLVFPATGKNRATIDKADIPRLDEGEFLNDNLIIFYLRYLQKKMEEDNKELSERVYFLNTWFFEKLKPTKGRSINYEGVKAWTAKVDIFSYDYIVVPVNEHTHWYVAIICHPGKLLPYAATPSSKDEQTKESDSLIEVDDALVQARARNMAHREEWKRSRQRPGSPIAHPGIEESPSGVVDELLDGRARDDNVGDPLEHAASLSSSPIDPEGPGINRHLRKIEDLSKPGSDAVVGKYDLNEPKIITLDSLGSAHSATCIILRDYLVQEIKFRKGIEIERPGPLGMTAKHIPEQMNYCDCGLFLLGYIQEFLKNPDIFVNILRQRAKVDWAVDSSSLRNQLRDLIFDLYQEQKDRLAGEKETKRKKQQVKTTQRERCSSPNPPITSDVSAPTPTESAAQAVPILEPTEARDNQAEAASEDSATGEEDLPLDSTDADSPQPSVSDQPITEEGGTDVNITDTGLEAILGKMDELSTEEAISPATAKAAGDPQRQFSSRIHQASRPVIESVARRPAGPPTVSEPRNKNLVVEIPMDGTRRDFLPLLPESDTDDDLTIQGASHRNTIMVHNSPKPKKGGKSESSREVNPEGWHYIGRGTKDGTEPPRRTRQVEPKSETSTYTFGGRSGRLTEIKSPANSTIDLTK
jgi:sentrin-specific protease 7